MEMGPAEIVSGLKELCAAEGPRLETERIVAWIEENGGFGSEIELIAFAKKMKARQYARMLCFEDDDTGERFKRLWSVRDPDTGKRAYVDILDMPAEERKRMLDQYRKFLKRIQTVRRAMFDYVAGQRFFQFYTDEHEFEPEEMLEST